MNYLNILNLIKCKYTVHADDTNKYSIILAGPATGVLYITENSPGFISGHLRMRGKNGGRYPYRYLEMIDYIFGAEENTIEVCSGYIAKSGKTISKHGDYGLISAIAKKSPFTVDINPDSKPDLVADGQILDGIPNGMFNRWRSDPPYNARTAKEMYGTRLPNTMKLLKAGARVCKVGSLMFLLGSQNYQWHPAGVKRIGYVNITVVPNNENRALNIFYKYADV